MRSGDRVPSRTSHDWLREMIPHKAGCSRPSSIFRVGSSEDFFEIQIELILKPETGAKSTGLATGRSIQAIPRPNLGMIFVLHRT